MQCICNHENNITICPLGYRHDGFVATHALTYIYIINRADVLS